MATIAAILEVAASPFSIGIILVMPPNTFLLNIDRVPYMVTENSRHIHCMSKSAMSAFKMAASRPHWNGSWKSWCHVMQLSPLNYFAPMNRIARTITLWVIGQFVHLWQLKWPPFGHFWLDLEKIASMLIPVHRPIIVGGNSKIYFRCVFWGINFLKNLKKFLSFFKIHRGKNFFFGKSSETPRKIILGKIWNFQFLKFKMAASRPSWIGSSPFSIGIILVMPPNFPENLMNMRASLQELSR